MVPAHTLCLTELHLGAKGSSEAQSSRTVVETHFAYTTSTCDLTGPKTMGKL